MERLKKDLEHIKVDGIDSGALFRRVCKYLTELVAYKDTGLEPERVAELAQAERAVRLVELPERSQKKHNGCDPGPRGPHGGPCPICGAPAMAQSWNPESDTCTCRACGYTF